MEYNSNSHGFSSKAYESYDMTDTRYYGVYKKGQEGKKYILVDPIRFQKIFGAKPEMKTVVDRRKYPLFRPAKKKFLDYNVNYMIQELKRIRQRWDQTNKPMINRVLSEICGKDYEPDWSDELAVTGVLTPEEVAIKSQMRTWLSHSYAEFKRNDIHSSLYAQFFHQLASETEALFLKTLTRNGYEGDRFNRNILYAFKGSNMEKVSTLDGFEELDKMYAIWNFIKHNSDSTFTVLKERFPETLKNDTFKQGEIACFHVKFEDTLIDSILNKLVLFIKGYCRLVFKEDEKEAQWNCEEYFYSRARAEINEIEDPFDLGCELFL
jgi:hypothetical protein